MNHKLPAEKKLKQKAIRAFIFLAFFYLLAMVKNAASDEFKLTPSLIMKEEYNDNILYSLPGDAQEDFITTISPGLKLIDKTERMNISLFGRFDRRWYLNHNERNASDQYYEGTAKYAITQRLNFSGKAIYSRDSLPDRDIETTGLMFTTVKRDRQNYTVSGDYLLSENAITFFSYDYLNDRYYSSEFIDSESQIFNAGINRNLIYFTKPTRLGLNINYAKHKMATTQVDNYEAIIFLDRTFNENWSLVFNSGVRYTKSRFVNTQRIAIPPFIRETKEENKGWGTVFHIVFAYKGERDSAKLSANLDILPSTGRASVSENTSFVFYFQRRFTYEFYGTLSGGYYLNKSRPGEFSTQEIDENTMRISPGIRYEFDNDKAIEASYTYSKTIYQVSGNESRQNAFFVRFKLQHDLLD